jgi:hypothetical protein
LKNTRWICHHDSSTMAYGWSMTVDLSVGRSRYKTSLRWSSCPKRKRAGVLWKHRRDGWPHTTSSSSWHWILHLGPAAARHAFISICAVHLMGSGPTWKGSENAAGVGTTTRGGSALESSGLWGLRSCGRNDRCY